MWYLIPLAAAYAAVNVLLWHRAVRLLRHIHGFFGRKWVICVFTAVYLFFFNSIWIWILFDNRNWQAFFKYINNIWIGIFIYAMIFTAAAELVTFVLWTAKKMRKGYAGWKKYITVRGAVVILLVIGFSVYGVVHYHDITVTSYDAEICKSTQAGNSMKIVLVADTHLGYSVGEEMMEKMVEKINAQNPDLVVFAGDLIDNDYYAVADPDRIAETLAGIKSKYGVYGCYGNHDVEEQLVGGFTVSSKEKARVQTQVDDFAEAAGISILQDEKTVIAGDITLIGRCDASKPNCDGERASIASLTADADKRKPIICIDHQPSELQEKADAGVDLDLCGHTHDGQIFPGNLTINLFWQNAYGLMKIDSMYSIVTSGAGVWGPAMRVGTDGEIVVINVNFK